MTENNGQNLINLIVNIIAENKEIKEFLNCVKSPEQRKEYLTERVSNLFNGYEFPKGFLDTVLYGIQLKTEIDLGYSHKYTLLAGKKIITTF